MPQVLIRKFRFLMCEKMIKHSFLQQRYIIATHLQAEFPIKDIAQKIGFFQKNSI